MKGSLHCKIYSLLFSPLGIEAILDHFISSPYAMSPKTSPKPKTRVHPFLLSIEDVASGYATNIETGLTAKKVSDLQNEYPPNELDGGGAIPWYKILIKQISNAMVLVSYPFQYYRRYSERLMTCRCLYLQRHSVLGSKIT